MSNSSGDVLSFTGDVCEDGTITVILAIGIFALLAFLKMALSDATVNEEARGKAPKKSIVKRLSKGSLLEDIFILPFVPSSLETFVMAIYFGWFTMTISMGISRYYENRWGNDVLAQQGPLNVLAGFLGCKGIPIAVIPYALQIPEPTTAKGFHFPGFGPKKSAEEIYCDKNPLECSPDIDFYFSHHLAFGILWLTFGALQIYLARSGWSTDEKVRRKAHKMFGMFVALPAFFCHIAMATRIAWRNPVNQVSFISMQYWAMIFESLLLAANGIWFAMEKNYPMHLVRMFFTWIQSVVGSGSIRLTAWVLWLIGKFFSLDTRILIDRGACQAEAINGYPQWGIPPTQMGSAEFCYKAVFLNLAFTDMLIMWLEWIFLCLPIAKFNKADRAATTSKFKSILLLSVIYILMVFVFDSPDWLIKGIISIWAFVVKMHTFRMYIASFLHDPMEAQVGETTFDKTKRLAKYGLMKLYLIEEPDTDDDQDEDDHPHQE